MSEILSRTWAMPTRDTFECPPIGEFVRRYLAGISIDPFARNNTWATYRNDLDPATAAEYHMDAEAFLIFLWKRGIKADCILFDPPYSPRQLSECYKGLGIETTKEDTQNARLYARVRRRVIHLCKLGTTVLSFGWNSAGMGEGFELLELLLVAHGGAHNDTICMAERLLPPPDAKEPR